MEVQIEDSWQQALATEFEQPYFEELADFVRQQYRNNTVYPAPANIFRAFELTPLDEVRVVILGQDPYHGPGQAHGLSFSVEGKQKLPPSLQNIFKELRADVGVERKNSNLSDWAEQGVLLLNATLTVQARNAGSHQGRGWEQFTNAVVAKLNQQRENLVFILWGNYARKKGAAIERDKHLVLESPHPSPLSAHRGFFGSQPFSKTNQYLQDHHKQPIEW